MDDELKELVDINIKELVCTSFEVQTFAFGYFNSPNLTVWNLCKWLESKTFGKYTIVKVAYIEKLISIADDAKKQLFEKEVAEIVEKITPLLAPKIRTEEMLNHFRNSEVF